MALFEKKIIVKNEIDYDKLAYAIEKAIAESETEKKKQIEKEEEEVDKNWRKTIGLKEHEKKENFFKHICINISNFFHMLKTFINYKNNYAKDTRMTFTFMAMISAFIFGTLQFMFILLSVVIIYLVIIATVSAWFLLFLLFTVFFAQLMHIIVMEIDQMENNEMINMIFSSLMAFIAALFTVISFVYTVNI